MSNEPNQDLPETDDDDTEEDAPEINQDLPSEKQPPRGSGNSRGKSGEAPGQTKPRATPT